MYTSAFMHLTPNLLLYASLQAIFGDARKIASCSDGRVVRCALPSVSTGHDDSKADGSGSSPAASTASESSESGVHHLNNEEEDEDCEDAEAEIESRRLRKAAREASAGAVLMSGGVAAHAPYEAVDSVTGAPCPMGSQMVTLSLLPRSQWESLANLEVCESCRLRMRFGSLNSTVCGVQLLVFADF